MKCNNNRSFSESRVEKVKKDFRSKNRNNLNPLLSIIIFLTIFTTIFTTNLQKTCARLLSHTLSRKTPLEKASFNWLPKKKNTWTRNHQQNIQRKMFHKIWTKSSQKGTNSFNLRFLNGSRRSIFRQETQRTWSTGTFKSKKPLYYQKSRKLLDYLGPN